MALWWSIDNTIRGKVVVSPMFGSWWVLWICVCPCLIYAPKVFQLCTNQLVVWFVQICVNIDPLFNHPSPKALCRNPSFGLATKAKGLQGCGPRESPGVTSHTPESVGKYEGVNPHTPKATPTLGDGILVDFQNFKEWFQGSKLNDLWRSLYHWKAFRT
jgi:hypothetical protein